MRQLVVGATAHVDAGKTTLTEAMLYQTGSVRHLGRVDHGDTFFDTDSQERQRGITIFSKQAILELPLATVTLVDTPGHVDFSAETERTLTVLDCALLVISGTEGVQAHTLTLWRLLERYHIPVFVFVNKMDLAGAERETVLSALKKQLADGFVDMTASDMAEEAATGSEEALAEYLETGALSDTTLTELVERRAIFPCFFGSALRLTGVDALLDGLMRFSPRPRWGQSFGARVYKISRDPQGTRLTHLKITGGSLPVKTLLSGEDWQEKADQIRLYSGGKFRLLDCAEAGTLCAVTGLTHTHPGQALGAEPPFLPPSLEPVLSYRVVLPEGIDPYTAWGRLRELEDEDPQLHLLWKEPLREIHLRLMGQVQLEVLQQVIAQRFGMTVSFGTGSILYRETIAAPVVGIGHYEPLRHYAEVQLLLEPLPAGSGLEFATRCSEDILDRSWQRLILTHLQEKTHLGVLTGSPITDMRLTLLIGKAHVKHTEGGDFRQATYRAVRQGLMSAESVLLEPWYDLRLELPSECLGRAMTDLQQMGGEAAPTEQNGERVLLTGRVPVAAWGDYWNTVNAYSRGRGQLLCSHGGYRPCHNTEQVVETLGYDPERDTENPADSVFCDHGAGAVISWRQVPAMAHLDGGLSAPRKAEPTVQERKKAPSAFGQEDKELLEIFERTYGAIRRPHPPQAMRQRSDTAKRTVPDRPAGPEYLLIDGYNIIFAWEELAELARQDLDAAREQLIGIVSNFQGYRQCRVILVFDAYRVRGGSGSVEQRNNISVVYTREAETADTYIERCTYTLAPQYRVRVATSDRLEQLIILGHGAVRLSAQELKQEVEAAEGSIRAIMEQNNRKSRHLNRVEQQAVVKRQASSPSVRKEAFEEPPS